MIKMNKLRLKIKERLSDIMDWMEYGMRCLYGRPSMMKQFIIVLIFGSFLSVISIYSIVSSIYNMGKTDAQKEFMEIKHAGHLELHQSTPPQPPKGGEKSPSGDLGVVKN